MKPAWMTLLFLLLTVAAALAADVPWRREQAVMDSLHQVPPRLRGQWLRERGMGELVFLSPKPDTAGLQVVGRWSYGPAYDVDGRITPSETLLALARGSGVSLVRVNRAATPMTEVLADINCPSLAYQVARRESVLCVATRAGVVVYDIEPPTAPTLLAEIPVPVNALAVRDTLLCVAGPDTFSVYGIGNPAAPHRLGYCLASGSDVSISGNTAFLADVGGLRVIDISNPASPHQVGTWGGRVISVAARNTICCVTQDNANQPTWLRFSVLNVANPASIQQLSYLDSCGGYDIRLDDSLVFLSGYYTGGHEFRIVSIADSANPVPLGALSTLGNNFGVWATSPGRMAAVADDYCGLDVVGIENPTAPALDTLCLRVGFAEDVSLDGEFCFVASDGAGMKVLDVTNPASPLWIGDVSESYGGLINSSVAARDSFAYACWFSPWLRVIDVTDPTHPALDTFCAVVNPPEDMVLRDSFLYVAEDYRFQVVNVARPRQPQVVGTCNLGGYAREVILCDTLAFVGNSPLEILSIADPSAPRLVGTWNRYARGIDLQDTILYFVAYTNATDDVLISLSVADPASPYVLDSVVLRRTMHDVVVVGTVAYCVGWVVQTVSVADPRNLRVIGSTWTAPTSYVRRAVYAEPYLYFACTDGGVCVLETLQVGVTESRADSRPGTSLIAKPTVTRGPVHITWGGAEPAPLTVVDAAGRQLDRTRQPPPATIDLSGVPDGVYFVLIQGGRYTPARVVKSSKRRQLVQKAVLLLVALGAVSLAAVKAYDVDVYRNYLATVTQGDQGVGQYFRMCVDSLTKASLWVADPDTHSFHVEVRDSATPSTLVAYGDTATYNGFCGWLNVLLEPAANKPVKGRTYKVVFTRPSGQAIEYAYDPNNPYKYGSMAA